MARRVTIVGCILSVTLSAVAYADPEPTPPATTDPVFEGRTDATRWHHAETIITGGAVYLGIELFANKYLAPTNCDWCTPPSFDASIYHHLLWSNPGAASTMSTITGYVAEPLFVLGTLVLSEGDERSFRRSFDDVAPVLESAIFAGLLQHISKYTVGRERPFAYFGSEAVVPASDRNLSFFSGHTVLDFALATSAGIVAHKRHSKYETLIWAGGMSLGVVTAYGRVAAGAHYFSDVTTAAVVGTGVGVGVPLLLHSDVWSDLEKQYSMLVVPGGPEGSPGLTLAGAF